MRLAFIKKRFSLHGGAERYLQTLIRQLRNSGYEIHVFANQWTDEEGITFHKIKTIPISSFLSTWTFNTNLGLKMRDLSFHSIISFERTTHQDIYRASDGCHAEWLRIRSQHEPIYKQVSFKINPFHLLILNIEKRIFKETRLIIANSRMVKEQIVRHYSVPEDKIRVIYNGVDLERFSPENRGKWREIIREKLGISKEARVLLFVGSGFERKGLITLIRSLALIKRDDLMTLIIGKGDIDRYAMLTKSLGLNERIIFLGVQKDIEKMYAIADLFVLPTLYDPFSNATLEAMASGIPVITTRNNGVSEIIEKGKEGYILDRLSDPIELADKIEVSLSNLEFMGKMARIKAEGFSIEDVVKTLERLILSQN